MDDSAGSWQLEDKDQIEIHSWQYFKKGITHLIKAIA